MEEERRAAALKQRQKEEEKLQEEKRFREILKEQMMELKEREMEVCIEFYNILVHKNV